jgi:hypothetical protein
MISASRCWCSNKNFFCPAVYTNNSQCRLVLGTRCWMLDIRVDDLSMPLLVF